MKNRVGLLVPLALCLVLAACNPSHKSGSGRGLMTGESPPAGSEPTVAGKIADAKPEWFACKVSSDCVPRQGMCGVWQAVNTASAESYEQYIKQLAKDFECTNVMQEETPQVECMSERCTVQPSESTRPGESTASDVTAPTGSQGQGDD